MSVQAASAPISSPGKGAVTEAGFRPLRRVIFGLRLGLTLAVLLGAAGLAWYEQQQQLARARTYAETTAASVADHTRASLDLTVRSLQLLEAQGIANMPAARQRTLLAERLGGLSDARALFLIDRAGMIRAHTGGASGSVTGRDFWEVQHRTPGIFLGHQQPGLGHFSSILPLTIALKDSHGFAGILGASLAPATFPDLLKQLRPQLDASYVLLRQGEPVAGTSPAQPSGATLVAVRELPEYGLTIEVHIPAATVLAQARGEVFRQIALALLAVIVLWLVCALLLRHLSRLEQDLYTSRRAEAGIDQSSVAMLWVQPDGRLNGVNAAAARLLMREPAELQHLHIQQLFQDFDADAWRSHWRLLRQNKAGHLELGWHASGEDELEMLVLQTSHIVIDQREYALVNLNHLSSERQADLRLRQIFRFAREYLALFRAKGSDQFVLVEANRPSLGSRADFDPADIAVLGAGEDLRQVATSRLSLKPAQVDFIHAMFRACVAARRSMSFGASVDLGLGAQYHSISLSPVIDHRGAVEAVLLSVRNAEDEHHMLETLEHDVWRLQGELRDRDRQATDAERDQARS